MSRPHATVLVELTNKTTHKTDQIIASAGIWAVYYNNEPINLKTHNQQYNPKYKKVSFSNSGHAINLAKKLNNQFKTSLFTVVKFTKGTTVYP